MIVYNIQQQLTGHCSFQEYSVLLQSPLRNNGNQGQHAIICDYSVCVQRTPVNLIGLVQEKNHNKQAIRLSSYHILLMINMKKELKSFTMWQLGFRMILVYHQGCV